MASRMTKADMAAQIAEQAELIEELRALIQAQNEAVADEAIEKVDAHIKEPTGPIRLMGVRHNDNGTMYNVAILDDHLIQLLEQGLGYNPEAPEDSKFLPPAAMAACAKALPGKTLGERHSRIRRSRAGAAFFDLYSPVGGAA